MGRFTIGFLSGALLMPVIAMLIAISGFWPVQATSGPAALGDTDRAPIFRGFGLKAGASDSESDSCVQ